MVRPREFDEDEVLDSAIQAFWAKGYEATSMADLMEAMDLKKGSIYQTFGSKHSLFVLAIQRYLDVLYAQTKEVFASAETPGQGLKRFLTVVEVEFATGCEKRIGCFGTNTLVELAPHDEEVREVIRNHKERYEALLAQEIAAGQKAGQFRDDVDPKDLAATVDSMIFGIMADCKTGECKTRTKKIVKTIFKLLEP